MNAPIAKVSALFKQYAHINVALVDQMMVSLVNFITGVLLARYLGLHEFGVFTIVWLTVLFVNAMQQAMIISPMMSMAPKQSEAESPKYFGAIFVQEIFVAFSSAIIIYAVVKGVAIFFPQWNALHLALPLAVSAFGYQSQDFIRRYFFTKNRYFAAFINDFLCYGGKIALLLWLFLSGSATSANVLWIIALTSTLACIAGIMQMDRFEWPTVDYLLSSCRRHWKFSKWLSASILLDWASGQFFTLAAGAYLGAAAAGAMQACQNIMGALHIMFFGLGNVVPVRAAKILHSDGIKAMGYYLRKISFFGGGITAIFAIVAAAAPELWLEIIYGDEFSGFGFLLRWYALIYLLLYFAVPLRAGLTALEDTKPFFWARVFTALFTFITIVPLISYFELAGAVFGIFCVRVIQSTMLMVALVKRIRS